MDTKGLKVSTILTLEEVESVNRRMEDLGFKYKSKYLRKLIQSDINNVEVMDLVYDDLYEKLEDKDKTINELNSNHQKEIDSINLTMQEWIDKSIMQESTIAEQSETIKSLESDNRNLKLDLDSADNEISDQYKKIESLESNKESIQSDLDSAKSDINSLKEAREQHFEKMEYIDTNVDAEFILNRPSFSDIWKTFKRWIKPLPLTEDNN